MAHIRGHIIKLSIDKSKVSDLYDRTGNFKRYIFEVTNYQRQEKRIRATNSFDPQSRSDAGNDVLLFLAKDNSLDSHERNTSVEIQLKAQGVYSYASGWTLDNKTNWLVYDQNDQEHNGNLLSRIYHSLASVFSSS